MDFFPTLPMSITPIMAFGMMLVIGALGGFLAHRLSWLPSITGFMIVGFLFGPSGIGLFSQEAIAGSQILINIALALILYRLGLSLDIKYLWRHPQLFITSLVESAATFVLVSVVLGVIGIPLLLSFFVAAIAISSSPAVLLHVAHEVGAKGEVTESTKTLVALNNLFSIVMFSALLPFVHYSAGAGWVVTLFQPLYSFFGSLLVGVILAYGLHAVVLRTREAGQYKLALVIGVIMIAVGLAYELKLSMYFIALTIGVVIKAMEEESLISEITFGPAFELFFIVLFVFAGAGLHLHELIEFAPAIFSLVLVRILAKVFGVSLTSLFQKKSFQKSVSSGLLLIPMAGLAIGLTLTSGNLFPQYASIISAVVLGAVTVFETIGPPIASYAFRLAGETAELQKQADNGEQQDSQNG